MTVSNSHYDAIIIGAGFYGCAIAIYLIKHRQFGRVLVIEQQNGVLQRASYSNQARVHNGYHYPRSFTTAYRSRINLPKFVRDWPNAVKKDFTKLYAIARRNSKVNARQFERFCSEIGAPFALASSDNKNLFDRKLIEQVFVVEEYAFDSTKLAEWVTKELDLLNVELQTNKTAISVNRAEGDNLKVVVSAKDSSMSQYYSPYVFNCSYSGINHLGGDFSGVSSGVKHEITEMALVELPSELTNLGVTVMDGAYFSIMPFPARGLHTVSHVRYTPHVSWADARSINPYKKMISYEQSTRFDRMIRDIIRYMPYMANAKYVDSLFEVKTILTKNEGDDGRPILFERHEDLPGCFSILGGKIDNIYDVLEKLDAETFARQSERQ